MKTFGLQTSGTPERPKRPRAEWFLLFWNNILNAILNAISTSPQHAVTAAHGRFHYYLCTCFSDHEWLLSGFNLISPKCTFFQDWTAFFCWVSQWITSISSSFIPSLYFVFPSFLSSFWCFSVHLSLSNWTLKLEIRGFIFVSTFIVRLGDILLLTSEITHEMQDLCGSDSVTVMKDLTELTPSTIKLNSCILL